MANSAAPPTPRWVKLFGAIALTLFAVFVALHLTGRGLHRHGHHPEPVGSGVP